MDLKEMDMALFGGLSDPYIKVFADPAFVIDEKQSELQSSVIRRNINPVWTDNLSVRIVTSDFKGLVENAHLFLTVWDHDLTKPDDLIGSCVLCFRDIMAKLQRGKAFEFTHELHNNGVPTGRLQGTVTAVNGLPHSLAELRAERQAGPLNKELTLREAARQYHRQGPQGGMCARGCVVC
jgi:Ca2+-dependent lipid-binding protein